MKKKLFTFITFFMLIFILAACNKEVPSSNPKEKQDKLKVYTTIYPFEYFTQRIGGEFVSVETIVPPGSDAHSIEVSPKKMVSLAQADAFIHSGTGLESFADAVVDSIKNEDVAIVNATENIDLMGSMEDSHADEENEDSQNDHADDLDVDPHVWLDPLRSIRLAENIKNALVKLNPEHTAEFEDNFEELKSDLETLDTGFKSMVKNADTKTFIVSHSAYGYWEDAYGLKQVGISGISPTVEPSQKKIIEIINLVKENNLKYIYTEPNLPNKIANTIKKATGTETLTLQNLESLSNKDLDANEDYFSIMNQNLEALKKGLNND
ncbi:metal ABC transporter solute-binding protein, Zn/Mn family [Siminovitchia sp. 179-K 8D1 HS]|uniref:metal ABC transporter solute-binding protein, Zn/Mn family n=1 Tax=Siminovitchia sp. 179-K 8D1 HS TaxID=3142385 RepID=UPI0039A3A92B